MNEYLSMYLHMHIKFKLNYSTRVLKKERPVEVRIDWKHEGVFFHLFQENENLTQFSLSRFRLNHSVNIEVDSLFDMLIYGQYLVSKFLTQKRIK